MPVSDEVLSEESWAVDCAPAVVAVCQRARQFAQQIGLGVRGTEAVAIAVSELANNIMDHAWQGVVVLRTVRQGGRLGLVAIARDLGPGIHDLDWALTDGCSSARGLGCGLPAVRRLMDDFSIESGVGRGTVVTVKKWLEEANGAREARGQ